MFKSKFLPVFTFLFIAVLASCNFSANKYGSIFLDFTSLKGSPSASRNLIDTYLEEDKVVYADLTIDGLLDEPYTLNLMEKPYYEQDEIPVGTKIQVTVEAYIITNEYDPENSRYILYKGTSNKKTIGGGPNTIKILMKELTKKIYVRYDEGFQNESSFIVNALERETYDIEDENGNLVTIKNDGKTPSTGFVYIQSAIDWIAEYGNSNNDYEIILTGYGEEACFNQSIVFGNPATKDDNLYGKVKESITISSLNPDITAISQDSTSIIIATNTNIIFTNIKLQANSSGTALIELGQNGNIYVKPSVTLAYGTSLEGLNNNISALYLTYAESFTMKGNSSIKGFNDGAISIMYGSCKMEDTSSITDCHATSGGAIYMTNLHNSFSLSNNAFISECSATSTSEGGGAIYMKGGTVSINGGSITSCSASNGGAIYSNLVSNTTSIYLAGGEIKDNRAEKGSAIYSDNQNSGQITDLHFSENAYVDPSNDIYLNSSINITLDSELTTDAETAALITLYSANGGSTIINCANSDTSILENCFSKFCVNPTGGDTQTNWYINEEGVLNEVDYILEEADPVQIGDLVFADNSRVRPENYPYLTYQMRSSLAGIVFYAGTEDDLLGEVNLIVGKKIYSGRLEDSEQQNPIQFEKTTQFNFPKETIEKHWTDGNGNSSTTYEDEIILAESLNIDEIQFDAVRLGNAQLTNFSDQIDSTRQLTYGSTYYFPLLHSAMHYYDDLIENNNQTESEFYGYDGDDLTNNWYIPTVAEYYELYLANKNPVFNEIFSSFCNLEDNSFITATQCDDHYWRMADGPSHYYHFIINFSENIIKCDVNNNYHSTIPIHTYSL